MSTSPKSQPKPKKGSQLSIRVSNDLKSRISRISQEYGLKETDIVIKCLEAFCDTVEKQGYIFFPLEVRPKGYIVQESSEDYGKVISTTISRKSQKKRAG